MMETAPSRSGFAPGDRVVGLKFAGAWAERVAVATTFLARIPDDDLGMAMISSELAVTTPASLSIVMRPPTDPSRHRPR